MYYNNYLLVIVPIGILSVVIKRVYEDSCNFNNCGMPMTILFEWEYSYLILKKKKMIETTFALLLFCSAIGYYSRDVLCVYNMYI